MSSKTYIKKAVTKFVREHSVLFVDYSNWYVGITSNPEKRDRQHGKRNIWRDWKAESVREARQLEKFFLDLGMRGNTGGGINANHVYVYKNSGPDS